MKTPRELRKSTVKSFLVYTDENGGKLQTVADFTKEMYVQAKKDRYFNVSYGNSKVSIFPHYMCFVQGEEEWDRINGVRDGK